MVLGFILPLVIDRDRIWWRLLRGMLMAAMPPFLFWIIGSVFGSYTPQSGRVRLSQLYVAVLLPYLVPVTYAVVRWLERPPK